MLPGTADVEFIRAIEELLPAKYRKITSCKEVLCGKSSSKKYSIVTESGDCLFAKINMGGFEEREKRVLARLTELAALGHPIVSTIAYGETLKGKYSVRIYPHLESVSKIRGEQSAFLNEIEQFGRSLHAFHKATLVNLNSRNLLFRQIERDFQWLLNRRALELEVQEMANTALNYLDGPGYRKACLIHGDLHGGNVLRDGNRIVLCDFDSTYLSDPLLDPAILRNQSNPKVFSIVLKGYGDIVPEPDRGFLDSINVAVRLRELKGAVEMS